MIASVNRPFIAQDSKSGGFSRLRYTSMQQYKKVSTIAQGGTINSKRRLHLAQLEMSKRKHNISYIKPDEPKFLQELKAQVGYKEGPSVDTKREALPVATDDDREDRDEELPTVVVLNNGDLTAEEAAAFEAEKEKEDALIPADLSKKIIFSKTKSVPKQSTIETQSSAPKKSKKAKRNKAVLSFNEDEED